MANNVQLLRRSVNVILKKEKIVVFHVCEQIANTQRG